PPGAAPVCWEDAGGRRAGGRPPAGTFGRAVTYGRQTAAWGRVQSRRRARPRPDAGRTSPGTGGQWPCATRPSQWTLPTWKGCCMYAGGQAGTAMATREREDSWERLEGSPAPETAALVGFL